jgi:hypothetical protein
MLILFLEGLVKHCVAHSEGIYLSEELVREFTVDEIKEHSVARRLPVEVWEAN